MTRLPCEVTFSHRSALSEPISSTTCTHHSLLNFNLWHWIEGTQILPRSPVTRESGNSFYLAGLYSPGSSQGKRRPVHVPPSTESGGGGEKLQRPESQFRCAQWWAVGGRVNGGRTGGCGGPGPAARPGPVLHGFPVHHGFTGRKIHESPLKKITRARFFQGEKAPIYWL